MELIRINDRKMKIMLTPSDMRHFELDPDTFCEDGTGMHRSFKQLLEEIKRQTGFEADDRRISIQYFPSREGGCEMFISRSADAEGEKSREKALQLHRRTGSTGFHRECAYRFEELSTLIRACSRLRSMGYIGSNSVYTDRVRRYYLLLSVLAESPFATPEELQFLSEYGTVESAPLLRVYLSEHGEPICRENAVLRLAGL